MVTREIDDACLGGALLFLHGHSVALTGKRWSGSLQIFPLIVGSAYGTLVPYVRVAECTATSEETEFRVLA